MEIPNNLETKVCKLGADILSEIPAVLSENWSGLQPVIVADENTWKAAGSKVMEILESAGLTPDKPLIFPALPELHADYCHISKIVPVIKGKAPVAVGSGTINDLVKLASFEAGCSGYICVATACSVDGYTSFGAAITLNGFKKTMACPAPLAVFADSSVLASAAPEMTAAGYSDLSAKIVAGADWHIADILGETPIDPVSWDIVQKDLFSWLDNPEKLASGDYERLTMLFKGLAATGFAMQHYRDSRPASGAEHLFSHVWEMDNLMKDGKNPSHGFKVAIGTLISTLLMEEILKWNTDAVRNICEKAGEISVEERRNQIEMHLKNTPIYESVEKVALDKLLIGEKLKQRRNDICEKWDEIKEKVKSRILPFEEMRRRFKAAGCPVTGAEIGLDEAEMRRGIIVAAMIRKRYTILDLLFELNQLEAVTDSILPRLF